MCLGLVTGDTAVLVTDMFVFLFFVWLVPQTAHQVTASILQQLKVCCCFVYIVYVLVRVPFYSFLAVLLSNLAFIPIPSVVETETS